MSEGNKEIDTSLIDRLVSDPSKVHDVVPIVGLAGKAPDGARLRLYDKRDLSSYVELNRADIVHADQTGADGTTEVYVRLDAKIATVLVMDARDLKPRRRKLELKLETIKRLEAELDADAMRMTNTETSRSPFCCPQNSRTYGALQRQREESLRRCVSDYCP